MRLCPETNWLIRFLCWVVLGLCCNTARAELTDDVIRQLKQATVFIQANDQKSTSSGSGFFVTQELIATNAHVLGVDDSWTIISGHASVVLKSGSKEERSIGAEIAGVDVARDIAFLRVPTQHEIRPLEFVPTERVVELMEIYVVGFPLGRKLDLGQGNPTASFTLGRVAALRRDDQGFLARIQVDASLVPGNSGGPIVNRDGQVVAMSVATVLGTNTGFSIPADQISEDLGGRVFACALTQNTNPDGSYRLDIKVRTIDPLDRIGQSAAYYWIGAADGPRPADPQSGVLVHGAEQDGPRKHIRLKRAASGDLWEGTLANYTTTNEQDLWVQPAIAVGQKVKMVDAINHSRDMRARDMRARDMRAKEISAADLQSLSERSVAGQIAARMRHSNLLPDPLPKVSPVLFASEPERTEDQVLSMTARLAPHSLGSESPLQLAVDPQGTRVYAIFEGESSIRVFSTDDFSLEATVSVARYPVSLWCDEESIVVACTESRVIQIVDATTLTVRHPVRLADPSLAPIRVVDRAPDGSLATIWQSGEDKFVYLVDEHLPPLEVLKANVDWCAFPRGPVTLWGQTGFSRPPGVGPGRVWELDKELANSMPSIEYRGRTIGGMQNFGHAFVSRDQRRFLLPVQLQLATGAQAESATLCFDTSVKHPVFHVPGYVIAENPQADCYVAWHLSQEGDVLVSYIDRSSGDVRRRIRSTISGVDQSKLLYPPITRNAHFVPGRELFLYYDQQARGRIYTVPCCPPQPTGEPSDEPQPRP